MHGAPGPYEARLPQFELRCLNQTLHIAVSCCTMSQALEPSALGSTALACHRTVLRTSLKRGVLCALSLVAASMCSYIYIEMLRMAVSDTIMSHLCGAQNQGLLLMSPGSPLPFLGSSAMRATLGCFEDGKKVVCLAFLPTERPVVPDKIRTASAALSPEPMLAQMHTRGGTGGNLGVLVVAGDEAARLDKQLAARERAVGGQVSQLRHVDQLEIQHSGRAHLPLHAHLGQIAKLCFISVISFGLPLHSNFDLTLPRSP